MCIIKQYACPVYQTHVRNTSFVSCFALWNSIEYACCINMRRSLPNTLTIYTILYLAWGRDFLWHQFKMGKRSSATGIRPVDQYRKQLGKHEKHLMTGGRSRDRGLATRTSKSASSESSTSPRAILRLGAVLVLLLVAIGVVYFFGFVGVVQLLYDAVEVVSAYWRGPASTGGATQQGASSGGPGWELIDYEVEVHGRCRNYGEIKHLCKHLWATLAAIFACTLISTVFTLVYTYLHVIGMYIFSQKNYEKTAIIIIIADANKYPGTTRAIIINQLVLHWAMHTQRPYLHHLLAQCRRVQGRWEGACLPAQYIHRRPQSVMSTCIGF